MGRGIAIVLLTACGRFGFDGGALPADTVSPSDSPRPAFAYRKPIAISAANNTAGIDLPNFPLAVRITDADLQMVGAGGKLETGADIMFFDADGVTPLAFDVDTIAPDSGDLIAWVKLPVLSATSDTSLYLAFGDPTVASTAQDRPGTWTGDYVGVWHFSEPSYSALADQTVDAVGMHPGTPSTNVTTIAGKLGRAASFGGNCANISVAASAALQPSSITVSAWVMAQDIGVDPDRIATVVAQDSWRAIGSGSQGYYLEVYRTVSQPQPTFYAASGPTYAHAFAASSVVNNAWYYLVGTYDATSGVSSVYVDGVLAGTATMTGPIDYLAKPVQFGCGPSGWWKGAIDEVMIASSARSAGAIAAAYTNQRDPAAFMTVAPTEVVP